MMDGGFKLNNKIMTKEEKEKLFIALCGYLPYGLLCRHKDRTIALRPGYLNYDDIRPYLRPMADMTINEIVHIQDLRDTTEFTIYHYNAIDAWDAMTEFVDYCNKRFLDYRGLIPAGLALPAGNRYDKFLN